MSNKNKDLFCITILNYVPGSHFLHHKNMSCVTERYFELKKNGLAYTLMNVWQKCIECYKMIFCDTHWFMCHRNVFHVTKRFSVLLSPPLYLCSQFCQWSARQHVHEGAGTITRKTQNPPHIIMYKCLHGACRCKSNHRYIWRGPRTSPGSRH